MNKLLLILLLFTQSLMATPRTDSQGFGVMVATCGICEKRKKELEEQLCAATIPMLSFIEKNNAKNPLALDTRNK
ncbi:hypothetical protein KVE62_03070 [Helicobacter pylori]|nr:hypothetical protein KVE62_03070 [Helicobacter pylori]